MAISQLRSYSWRCDECGQEVSASYWAIVDLSERPDLLAGLRHLTQATCPDCRATADFQAPLILVNLSVVAPIVIVADVEGQESLASEMRRDLFDLANNVARQAKVPVPAIEAPRRLLRRLASSDIESDLQKLLNRTGVPTGGGDDDYNEWLSRLPALIGRQRVNTALDALWTARSDDEFYKVIRCYPELRSKSAEDEECLFQSSQFNSWPTRLREARIEVLHGLQNGAYQAAWECYKAAMERQVNEDFDEFQSLLNQITDAIDSETIGISMLEICEKAISMARNFQEADAEAWLLCVVGSILQSPSSRKIAGALERGIAYISRAIEIHESKGNALPAAVRRVDLAAAYTRLQRGDVASNLEESIHQLEVALETLTEDNEPRAWAMAETNLAMALTRRSTDQTDNAERALKACKAALRVRNPQSSPIDYAYTMINMGVAHSKLRGIDSRHVDDALTCYQNALSCLDREKNPVEWSQAQYDIAYLNAVLAEDAKTSPYWQVAEKHARLSLLARSADADAIGWAESSLLLGKVLSRLEGGEAEAIEVLRKCLTVFTPFIAPSQCIDASTELRSVLIRGNRWLEAADVGLVALQAAEVLLDDVGDEKRKMDSLADWATLWRWTSYTLTRASLSLRARGDEAEAADRLIRAVEALDRGRARQLGDAIQRDNADLEQIRRLDPMLAARFIDARDNLRRVRAESGSASGNAAAVVVRFAVEAYQRALHDIRSLFPAFLRGVSIDELRNELAMGEKVVYLLAAPLGACALIVSSIHSEGPPVEMVDVRGINSAQIIRLLTGDVNKRDPKTSFLAQLYNGDYRNLSRLLSAALKVLGIELMKSVADRLQCRPLTSIILIPAGPMGMLPLHAAPWADGSGVSHCLLDMAPVAYAPSALAFLAARRRSRGLDRLSKHLVALGDPKSSAVELPGTQAELDEIARIFPGRVTMARGPKASREFLIKELPSATHIHLSCHGTAVFEEPLQSALVLADDELLTLEQLTSVVRADVRLAVVSACYSATIDTIGAPDEMLGVAIGFLQAGAAAALAALWPVYDHPSALLITRFYELLSEETHRDNPAGALRAAQMWLRGLTYSAEREYLNLHPSLRADFERMQGSDFRSVFFRSRYARSQERACPYSDPYHWAAFVLYGW